MKYQVYKWCFMPQSSCMTPWTADTLWGHIMWAIRYQQGEEIFERWLSEFKGQKQVPWIVSDAFPEGKLPLIRKGKRYNPQGMSKKEAILVSQVMELLDEIQWIDTDLFEEMRKGLSLDTLYKEVLETKRCPITLKKPKLKVNHVGQILKQMTQYRERFDSTYSQSVEVTKNSINRLTGSTGKEDGELYTQTETLYHTPLEVYVKVREDVDIKLIKQALEYVELTGYGKKASTGKGQIKTISFEKEEKLFQRAYEGDAFMVLSTYIPKVGDYTDIIHATSQYKKGKVGAGLGEVNVFKSPFRYYEAGSVFVGRPEDTKGQMLGGLHVNPAVVQYGIPFVVGVSE